MEILDRSRDLGPFVAGPDDDMLVCRCEEITKGEIRRAEVRRWLRVGMGLCQGNTCGRIVKGIIAAELGIRPAELEDCTPRGPVRPAMVEVLGKEVFDRD